MAKDPKNFDDHVTKRWKLSLRTLALALPNKNKITPRFCKANIPNQYIVSRAALKAKSTPRLNALADYNKHSARKKSDRITAQSPEVFVKRSALKAVYSPRLDMLARSPLAKLETTLETYKHVGDHFRLSMKKNINLARTSMYREFYWPKSMPKSASDPKLKSCQYTNTCPTPLSRSETFVELAKWCDANSKPKPVYKKEPIVSMKRKPLVELTRNLQYLATPRYISKKYDPTEAEKFSTGVSIWARSIFPKEKEKSTVNAVCPMTIEHIDILAKPRTREDLPMRSQEINLSNIPEVPNPRIVELARPRQRTAGNNDEKENPFNVNIGSRKKNLKFKCSPRTAELAKPRKRR